MEDKLCNGETVSKLPQIFFSGYQFISNRQTMVYYVYIYIYVYIIATLSLYYSDSDTFFISEYSYSFLLGFSTRWNGDRSDYQNVQQVFRHYAISVLAAN